MRRFFRYSATAAIALALTTAMMPAGNAFADGEVSAQLRLEGREAHVGMPFVLSIVVEGLDEDPAPKNPTLSIPGVVVTPMPPEPNISQSIQIINGRRRESHSVTWVLRYRLEVAKAGEFQVPALTVTQGSKSATTDAARLRVGDLPTTSDMKFTVSFPDRPVWIGESIPVQIDWLVRRSVSDQSFSIPILSMGDTFSFTAPPVTDPRQALAFSAGGRDLQLPFVRDSNVDVGGQKFTRFRFSLTLTPKKAGHLEVPAASVSADLAVGNRRDFFGNSDSQMFRVSDVARTIDVKPLPLTDRPSSFSGAVGSAFSIAVSTSRSVVQVGEPVDLNVTVRGDQGLDVLSLPRLDGEGELPKDKFTVPADSPTGEMAADGKAKTFRVPVEVVGQATEIPALAFAYFDPVKANYQIIHSEPIALSVKGNATVGASDVVATPNKSPAAKAATTPAATGELSLVGADLALSAPDRATSKPLAGSWIWFVVGALYGIPLLLLLVRTWQRRTEASREEAGEVRAARKQFDRVFARAATAAARDVAGELLTAARALAKALDRPITSDVAGLLGRIETESFAPAATATSLSPALRAELDAVVRGWLAAPRSSQRAAAVAIAMLVVAFPLVAHAEGDSLATGRAAYQNAMAATDAAQRRALFGQAQDRLNQAAIDAPGSPELLADLGNAALGAGDVAHATLAFRRALMLDAGNLRARRNLEWLRGRQPSGFRPSSGGAADTLFFFHEWPRARRWLVGAGAFSIAILLIVPWRRGSRRGLLGLALIPFAVWLAMMISLFSEDRRVDDAIVMQSAVLRAADSAGAPAAITQPIAPGVELAVVERRDAWVRVKLGGGVTGWLPAGTIEFVR